jgi:hypothetical protein
MNFSLPPDISFTKEQLEGCQAYVFRHDKLGEIGRILFQGLPNDHCHLSSEVSGDPSDPMTETRKALFDPLSRKITASIEAVLGTGELGNSAVPDSPRPVTEVIESKLIPCEKCGVNAAMLIFADDATEPSHFEDYARKMYTRCTELDVATWIIGSPKGPFKGSQTPTDTMKIWPEREPIKILTADNFNKTLDMFLDKHCS